ncbi:MAG TPA: hypothetical protein VF553_06140 [Pyrinomonadaceae bacterium]|jgi:hypothetical protein
MEQKRKIIIPLGGASREASPARDFDGSTTVPAPLFDAEATLGARPVVPIAEAQKSRSFPLLALVVLLAVSAGIAGGFAIGLYRSRQPQQSATSPQATTTIGTDTTAQQQPAQQLPATTATAASERTSEPVERTTASNAPVEQTARDSRPKRDEEEVIPPVEVRQRPREERVRKESEREARDRDERIAADDEREIKRQKRERRRRARENDERDTDVNQQIERGARELNRIREIFEGQRP